MTEPLILRDKVLLEMLKDAEAGRPTTQLSLAYALDTTRPQVCIALQKLGMDSMVERATLLGCPPSRGMYSYRLTLEGKARAKELEARS